jgi:hypothetical protein
VIFFTIKYILRAVKIIPKHVRQGIELSHRETMITAGAHPGFLGICPATHVAGGDRLFILMLVLKREGLGPWQEEPPH